MGPGLTVPYGRIRILKWMILWTACAVLCILYGLMVLGTASGTGFWLVWIAMGAFFLLCALCARLGIWLRLPVVLRGGLLALLFVGAALFVFVEAQILRCFRETPEPNLNCLIVLGAQIRQNGPSTVLRYRLDTAAAYLKENPDTICIVSGGQGANEPCPEAVGMREYLVSHGIDGSRIFTEEASRNTRENLAFSLLVTGRNGAPLIDPARTRVGIVTNNFHIYRGCAIARRAGLAHVSGLPAGSTLLYLPNNLLREFLGVVKDRVTGNM